MDIDIHSTQLIVGGALDGKLIILEGSIQTIQASSALIQCVAISDDKGIIVAGGQELKVFIYGRESDATYLLRKVIDLGI